MKEKKDIKEFDDIKLMVKTLYGGGGGGGGVGPIFNERIGNNWPKHLEKMYRFWQTVLLHVQAYSGSPFLPHATLPIDKTHFDRWLSLFKKTITENFEGEVANDAIQRASNMAQMFQFKIAHYQGKTSLK